MRVFTSSIRSWRNVLVKYEKNIYFSADGITVSFTNFFIILL